MSYRNAFTILLLVALVSRHAAQESAASDGAGGSDLARGSPQYIYMQQLHSKLMDEKEDRVTASLEAEDGGGTLLATSFESFKLSGITEGGGFSVESGNILTMVFAIPKQQDVSLIQKAELWLFPDMLGAPVQPNSLVNVVVLATASIPGTKRTKQDSFVFTWKPEEGSIPIDLTALTLKVARKISTGAHEAGNVTIKLEILDTFSTEQSTAIPTEGGCGDLLPACIALQERTSNVPFLVIKYFTYGGEPGAVEEGRQEREAGASRLSSPQWHSPGHRRQAPASPTAACSVSDLFINLTETYGQFVMAPLEANIGDCKGTCVSSNYRQYSSHALVKERVNFYSGGAGLSVCCSPSAFGPLELLIYQNGYYLIVEFSDMVATACSCR